MTEPKTDQEIQLFKAVEKGDINETKQILSSFSLNTCNESYFDYHLVMKAIDICEINIAKLLVGKGFRVYKSCKSNQERTVLHAAVANKSKDKDIIKTLLTKGASFDILSLDEQNKTPLQIAIDGYRLFTIELFLSHCDSKTLNEKYLLHYAIQKDKINIVLLLIEKGFSLKQKDTDNLTPFCIALRDKNMKILNILLENCSVKNINPNNFDDIAPAYIASIGGHLKIIQRYVDSGLSVNDPLKLNINTWACLKDYNGFTLLHCAVKHVNLNVVEYLIEKGANILVQNGNGLTPLHLAFEVQKKGEVKCWQDRNSVISVILQASTEFNSNPIDDHGLSHFHIACFKDYPTVVKHFLKLGVSINQRVKASCHDYGEFSPLHFAALNGNEKIVKLLLKNRADVHQRDYYNMTALHTGVKEGFFKAVTSLLRYGACIHCIDSHGNTPLHWAFENGDDIIMDLLLSVENVASSNPTNSEGISHFHIACTRNNVNVVKSFIEKGACIDTCIPLQTKEGEVNVYNGGYSPLHFATFYNKPKIVTLLLYKGANVDIRNWNGETPFQVAIDNAYYFFLENTCGINEDDYREPEATLSHKKRTVLHDLALHYMVSDPDSDTNDIVSAVSTLIKLGVNVNSRDLDGRTALHWACAKRNDGFASILLKNGADINLEDDTGKNVWSYLDKELSELAEKINRRSNIWFYTYSKEELSELDKKMERVLQEHIVKMNVIGLPVSEKIFSDYSEFGHDLEIMTGKKTTELIKKYQKEITVLQNTKIHENCTLYDVIFKNENDLSLLINHPNFEDIVYADEFEKKYSYYGYLIQLKYQAGVDRRNLFPAAKSVLNELAKLHIPNECCENIFKYFTNVELKESTEIFRNLLDSNVENLNNRQLKDCKTSKRQKIN